MAHKITQTSSLDRRRTVTLITICLIFITSYTEAWQMNVRPMSELSVQDFSNEVRHHIGSHFTAIHIDHDSMLVGARNGFFNLSLSSLTVNSNVTWVLDQDNISRSICIATNKTVNKCHNYIKVIQKKSDNEYFICGTGAYSPKCRLYALTHNPTTGRYQYTQVGNDIDGRAICPLDPDNNNTALFTGSRLFAGTELDFTSYLVYGVDFDDNMGQKSGIRTPDGDSVWINEPNFVNSIEYGEKVYFFFRESAIENINCGKAVFSRVAQTCKNDQGNYHNEWTTFFKARLNCSVPGDFPFYFDEIQSTSEIGKGNFKSFIRGSGNQHDMIYAVFNTPSNSITGSAICAFKQSDIDMAFKGTFKSQEDSTANWLPVMDKDIPIPHPSECPNANSTWQNREDRLNFIRGHPIMDKAVPSFGGGPLFMQSSFDFRFTQIAIDWGVLAADNRHYDVMFVGTDDGRVLKAINVGQGAKIETSVIEDIQVFAKGTPITNLKIYKQSSHGQEKLVVVSKNEIKTIPLHRCHLKTSCSECVALKDPYCSWTEGQCANSEQGFQNLISGQHSRCPWIPRTSKEPVVTSTEMPSACTPCAPCLCPNQPGNGGDQNTRKTTIPVKPTYDSNHGQPTENPVKDKDQPSKNKTVIIGDGNIKYGASFANPGNEFSTVELAISIVVSVVLSLFIGFLVGFKFNQYRQRRLQAEFDRTMEMRKSQNINSSSNMPNLNVNQENYLSPDVQKQLNVVLNIAPKNANLPNGSAETKVQAGQKVKKVYL